MFYPLISSLLLSSLSPPLLSYLSYLTTSKKARDKFNINRSRGTPSLLRPILNIYHKIMALDRATVIILTNKTQAEDDARDYRFEELGRVYSATQIRLYNLMSVGFEATAKYLAREIPELHTHIITIIVLI